MASGAGNEAMGAHPGGELTAEEVGEAEFEADWSLEDVIC